MKLTTLYHLEGVLLLLCITLEITVQTVQQNWSEQLLCLDMWLIGVVGFGMFCCLFRGEKYQISIIDVLMLGWWLYVVVRSYLSGEVPCARGVVVDTSLFVLFVIMRIVLTLPLRMKGCFGAFLLLVVAYEIFLGGMQLYQGHSLHVLYPVTGSFFNPGPYSALVAMGMVMALYYLYLADDGTWKKQNRLWLSLCLFVLIGGCVMLSLTCSRSAIVVVALMVGWLCRGTIMRYKWAFLIVALIAFLLLFWVKKESAMGRIVLWGQSLLLCVKGGAFGTGLGSFKGEYACQLQELFANPDAVNLYARYTDVVDYAFCDILQIIIEQGWIGGMFSLSIILLALRNLYRQRQDLFFALMALVVFCLFSYPFQLLPFQVLAICCIAYGAEGNKLGKMSFYIKSLSLLVLLVVVCGCWRITRQHVDADQEYRTMAGVTHQTFIKDYNRLLPLCADNPRFLFDYAKLLQANEAWMDSNAMLRRGTKISNDPMFWVVMGNNYQHLNLYAEALACYDTAYHQMPNRLYPLYQKMLLYERTGDKNAMRKMAMCVEIFEPKVQSPAVSEMKSKARKLLKCND